MITSVIIPTKNEPLINELISEIHNVLKNINHEIIVVDKSDKVPEINGAKLIIQKSDGLGNAIMEGIRNSKGDIIITMDGDFSHDPKDIKNLLLGIDKGYDIVIGSKYIKGGKTEDPFIRVMISTIANFFARKFLGIKVKDPMSGFSAVKRKVYENVKLNPLGYKIMMELIYKAQKLGYKVGEAPITFHQRKAGKSKFNIKEVIRFLKLLFRLRFKGE